MLGKLFSSNARVKILKLFLLNPENKYYIRQLSRDLKLQVNSVRRELDNLEKFGLLTAKVGDDTELAEADLGTEEKEPVKVTKQDKKYYQVDTKFVLYDEIRALIIKAQLLYEQDFVDKILKVGRPRLFVLSGFFVNNPQAPTDMLLVGKLNKEKLTQVIKELEIELGREINYTLLDQSEFEYRRSMTDMFVYSILEGKRMVIVDDFGLGQFH